MKRAFIIGGSRGVGRYLAEGLRDRDFEVLATARTPKSDVSTALFSYFESDLASTESVERIGKTLADYRPHLIVNNAVCYSPRSNGKELDDIEALFRVNALSPFRILSDHISSRENNEALCCVVINSDSIFHANRFSGAYAASKAALRVLTSALSDEARQKNCSVATLSLGPLEDEKKLGELIKIAERKNVSLSEVTRHFLSRSNPSLVIDTLIAFPPVLESVIYIERLGRIANGMVCRLDGGSAGSLL